MLETAVGLAAGILSGMGVGGGSILVLYLTLFAGYPQQLAQGINLLYFLPAAAAALVVHWKNKALNWRAAVICALAGSVAAAGASLLASYLEGALLKKLFAGLILCLGLRELFGKKKEETTDQ